MANSVLSFMFIYLPRHILSPLKTHKASRVVCPPLLALEQWSCWGEMFYFFGFLAVATKELKDWMVTDGGDHW